MGLVFGIPFSQFITELFSEPLKLFKTIITYWWLCVLYRKRRLDVFVPMDTSDLSKLGIYISESEQRLESPEHQLRAHTTDSVLIFGGNSSGDYLVARVCREQRGHVAWLLLELSDGTCLHLPYPEKSYPPNADFLAGGLRIKCNVPTRRWRVSYNGLLKRVRKNDDDVKYVHVKFSFQCISTSFVFDAFDEIHPRLMTQYLANEPSMPWIPDHRKLTKYLNRYVQPVALLGTISIEGVEGIEYSFYGAKHRARDTQTCRNSSASELTEFINFTKDGQMIYSGIVRPPGFKNKLQFGHFMERCGLAWPVLNCKHSFPDDEVFSGMKVDVSTGRSSVSAEVSSPISVMLYPSGQNKGHTTRMLLASMKTDDGDTGHSLILEHSWTAGCVEKLEGPAWRLPTIDKSALKNVPLLLPLTSSACRDSSLSGGKGASLAALTHLSTNYKTNFKVPSGFVVTTAAYKEFYNKSGIKNHVLQFEKKVLSCASEMKNETCHNLVNQVSKAKLPTVVEDAIRRQLLQMFPDYDTKKRFAVRSSASGEDSEELSAAGQMSTFLGVQGVENILQAVVKCWASQFSFTAVEYKRQNGQELNSLMAVVIQEMVPADVAGVLFTCDPVTGNPENVTITANYGIGESVVSASAEPDTVVLQRDHTNRVAVKTVQIGKKKTKIVLADGGNVVEKANIGSCSNICSISSENSKSLAETCLKVEEAYGFPIDAEWAFKDNKLFLLQARPVTTFDRETKYEIEHSTDDAFRNEDEYNTKANVGEVLVGACSHLGQTYFSQIVAHMYHILYVHRNPYTFAFNPYQRAIPFSQNHAFISVPNFVLRFYERGTSSFIAESNVISGFGRMLEDQEVYDQADRRNKTYPSTFIPYQLIFFIYDLLFAEMRLNKAVESFWKEEIDLRYCKSAKEMYLEIWKRTIECIYASARHMDNTLNSSIYNSIILGILATSNKGWDTNVYSDFSKILSSCGNVESADVPLTVQLILKDISKSIDVSKFKEMDVKDALNWLETAPSSAGKRFRDMLNRHGHRCLKEFDVYSKPWRVEKLPLIKILQDSVNQENNIERKTTSASEVIEQLKVPLSWKQRILMKMIIPLSRRAVGNREKSKSLIVKHFDFARKAFWVLAEQMTKEGRLPDKELFFFLTEHEVMQLFDTRSPLLIQRAVRRRQIFPELNRLRFPEIVTGAPKPVNAKREDLGDIPSDLEMKGIPVSQGVTKGIVRVATNLKEATAIQKGEILIAYCTDIAWSPYFPLLSGIATELGGLISHGAVVAREYGLPCVVGVFDATLKFKTGDTILLDGNRGILKRISQAS